MPSQDWIESDGPIKPPIKLSVSSVILLLIILQKPDLSLNDYTPTFNSINMLSISTSKAHLASFFCSCLAITHVRALPTLESTGDQSFLQARDEVTPSLGVSNPNLGVCVLQLSL